MIDTVSDLKEVEDGILVELATLMGEKLTLYSSLVSSEFNLLCRILNPRFENAGEEGKIVLRKYLEHAGMEVQEVPSSNEPRE